MMLLTSFSINAQMNNYKIYAGFVNHFTKYVQFSNVDKEFVIGVLGDSPMYNELILLNGKTIGAQIIVVKKVNTASDVTNFKILFVTSPKDVLMAELDKKAKLNKTMIITESENAVKGVDINFIIVNGKINFQIIQSNNELHGLKISNDLKKLGIIQ